MKIDDMKNKMLKLLVSCMTLVFFVNGTVPSVSNADEYKSKENAVVFEGDHTSRQRIVVSMGDSYSSGEGLGSYYGSSDPNSGDKFVEFLAHQSKNSWPGMLELPEVGKMNEHKARSFPDYSYDPNAKLQWYFVASSGAETKDILGHNKKTNGKTLKNVGQEKEYSIAKDSANIKAEVRSAYFNPQISVLEYLKKQGVVPDYITLTIGGNDLGFADIISEACMENRYYTYFLTNNLNKKLNEAQNKLDNGTKKEKSVRQKLRETYRAINDVFKDDNKKPCILVAGYPRLLDPNGKGLLIEKSEATAINDKVTYFNEAIKTMVGTARDQDGINIEYIDVEKAFGTDHGAYSKNAWINEVVLIPRESDINKAIYIKRKENWLNIASAQSMHPNKYGAKCYAECFQKVINKKEKVTTKEALTPTPIPTPTVTPTPFPAPTLPETTSLNPTKGSESDPTSSSSTSETTEPKSAKQLAYAAYLKVLQKNKKAIKAYKSMNIFSKKEYKDRWSWANCLIQKSSNKNCALCELTGDSVPELMFITYSKKKIKFHVFTYNSSKKKAVEILSINLSADIEGTGKEWYLGYVFYRTNDNQLFFFSDLGLGNCDSGNDADLYKYDGKKLKIIKTFRARYSSDTEYLINKKKYSYKKFQSEKKKIVNTNEQVIFYTVIWDSVPGQISRSKKLKSVAMTYDSCVKTLKG